MNVAETQIFVAAQDARTAAGVPTLTSSVLLDRAAGDFARQLADAGRISHYGLDGSTPDSRVAATGYAASVVLENAGMFVGGSLDSRHARATAAFVTTAYPDHLAQTVDPRVTQIGVGVVDGEINGLPTTWAVVDLARPVALPEPALWSGVVVGITAGALLRRQRRDAP